VIKALNAAIESGEEISVSAIARKAGVNRSLLYRHPDLHAMVLTKAHRREGQQSAELP
jgi:transposase-like protein